MALGIDPCSLHSCVDGAHHISVGVITEVQHGFSRHIQLRCGCMKNSYIWLGHAKRLRTKRRFEVRPSRGAKHIGIAVGQTHQRVSFG